MPDVFHRVVLQSGIERFMHDNRNGKLDCAWCGNRPKRLYTYGRNRAPYFCNKQCYIPYWM